MMMIPNMWNLMMLMNLLLLMMIIKSLYFSNQKKINIYIKKKKLMW